MIKGTVQSVNISDKRGVPKDRVGTALLIAGHGLEGDAHAGKWHRQVSLLALESIEKMQETGFEIYPGMIGENLTTSGIEVVALPVGTRLKVGSETVLEITQVRKAMDDPTAVFYYEDGEKKPLDVVFASVESGGHVSNGDEIEVAEKQAEDARPATVTSVNISEKTGVAKENVGKCKVEKDHGFKNDAHAGKWHRQVSLLADESIAKMKEKGLDVAPGAFGENITTSGMELNTLPVGQRLKVGERVILEVTQIGKECTKPCSIYYKVGDCVMPREGIFAAVIEDGEIATGDSIELID